MAEVEMLPNRNAALVEPLKLTGYLLSETHPVGGPKARYFRSAGFEETNAALLEQALLAIARTSPVVTIMASPHGVKYTIDGSVTSPSGAVLTLRTIWIIDEGNDRPRFVTAYPA